MLIKLIAARGLECSGRINRHWWHLVKYARFWVGGAGSKREHCTSWKSHKTPESTQTRSVPAAQYTNYELHDRSYLMMQIYARNGTVGQWNAHSNGALGISSTEFGGKLQTRVGVYNQFSHISFWDRPLVVLAASIILWNMKDIPAWVRTDLLHLQRSILHFLFLYLNK